MTLPGFFEGTGMPDSVWWSALWPDPAKVLADVGVRPGMKVVDLCSGDGWFTVPLTKIASQVVGIDIDPDLLARAQSRLDTGGAENVTLIHGDAYGLATLVPDPVDFVLLANAFHGVPDRQRLARAAHDVLRPDGLFGVVNWHKRPRETTHILGEPRGPATEQRMSPAETIAPIIASGFAHQFTVEIAPHHYGAVFQRI